MIKINVLFLVCPYEKMDPVEVFADGIWYPGVVGKFTDGVLYVKFEGFEPELVYWPEGR